MKRFALAGAAMFTLAGCAITQQVQPVSQVEGPQICIVQDLAVRPGFLDTYLRVMSEKGFQVKQLPPGGAITDCPVTSTYLGRWSWDLALYLSYAEIKVFKGGQPAGQAVYDSRQGGANMAKFIKGEEKIAELVNQLFPGRAPAVAAASGAAR